MLACPICHKTFADGRCECRRDWTETGGVPDLYMPAPEAGEDVRLTERVRAFYEERPFPDYRPDDDLGSLVRNGRANPFTRWLDEEIPPRAKVLEIGCGTGQMSNFLGVAGREVVGLDLTMASLLRAEAFRRRAGLATVTFVRGNLFRLPIAPGSADVVIANGVLHHTADCRAAFRAVGRAVAPGGYLVVGLYNRYGRALLPLVRDEHAHGKTEREKAWYHDQHQHPVESRHTADEVLDWLAEDGFEFVNSCPSLSLGSETGRLFERHSPGTWLGRTLAQLSWVSRARDGGLWVTVGQKQGA
ncbi:MAG: class I SAM-dependent methyltransferase [Deltaproteobacteria bacterium]|nr:class I SAM-dependent methyltransferase [Deltaproteobacteria bacterium]